MKCKIPCVNCIILAICINQDTLRCNILLDFLDKYQNSSYQTWTKILASIRNTLKGHWCVVGINDRITKVQKDRKESDSFY